MRYGIDLDGVCFDFINPFIKQLKQNLNIDIAYDDVTSYYWYNCIKQLDKEVFWEEFQKFTDNNGYENLKIYDHAMMGMKELLKSDNDVWILTHRPKDAYEATVNSLQSLFGMQEEKIIFSRGTKSFDVNRLDIDVFIDDAKHNVFDIAENTDALVYLMDQPYNRDFKYDSVIRVNDWYEFLQNEGFDV